MVMSMIVSGGTLKDVLLQDDHVRDFPCLDRADPVLVED